MALSHCRHDLYIHIHAPNQTLAYTKEVLVFHGHMTQDNLTVLGKNLDNSLLCLLSG